MSYFFKCFIRNIPVEIQNLFFFLKRVLVETLAQKKFHIKRTTEYDTSNKHFPARHENSPFLGFFFVVEDGGRAEPERRAVFWVETP